MKNAIRKITLIFIALFLGFSVFACSSAVEVEGDNFSAKIRRGERQNPGENVFNITLKIKELEEVNVRVVQLQPGLTKWAKQLREIHIYDADLHFSVQGPGWPECEIDTYSSFQIITGGERRRFYQLHKKIQEKLKRINLAVDEVLKETYEGAIVPEVY
jgi:hypothetical protein